jgi:hypothetical protein
MESPNIKRNDEYHVDKFRSTSELVGGGNSSCQLYT